MATSPLRCLCGVSVILLVLTTSSPCVHGQGIPSTDQTLWLQAGAAFADGITGRVTSWADQSPNGYTFTGASTTGPLLQSSGPGGHPYLSYDLLNASLSTPSFSTPVNSLISTEASTAFFVINPQGQVSPLSWGDGNTGVPFSFAVQEDSGGGVPKMIFLHGQGEDIQATPPDGFFGTWNLVTVVRDGDAGQIRVNGTARTLTSNLFDDGVISDGLGSLAGFIELGGPGGNAAAGDSMGLAEMLLYRTALPETTLLQVESTLMTKYDIVTAVVPEPSSYLLAGFGLLAFVLGRHCYRRH